jgi:hypothetical protein
LAVDIDPEQVAATGEAIAVLLTEKGLSRNDAAMLACSWVREADFLRIPLRAGFDFVVGNPPYTRIEQLLPEIKTEYERLYSTFHDRADLYVAFIERSLTLLGRGGVLSFICADRWTKNKCGARLRALVASRFSVRTYIDLHTASPFDSKVNAYPSIFVIGRKRRRKPVQVFSMSTGRPEECLGIREHQRGRTGTVPGVTFAKYPVWFRDGDPWVTSSPKHLSILRLLEDRFPLLEASGQTSVRIGVTTGADGVYIVPSDADIEPDRLLPLVMRGDCERGKVKDAHRSVINTSDGHGTVDLAKCPRLRRYLEPHADRLKKRYVAKKNGAIWYRTIDRVYPELVAKPKLLIPDIARSNAFVYESGRFYPHHNLYFVTSEEWDLEVLGGLLSSRVALFFVWSYTVKMRGGYLRFQAQYLRRIRVPPPEEISRDMRRELKSAFQKRDFAKLDELSRVIYGLDKLPEFDFVETRT